MYYIISFFAWIICERIVLKYCNNFKICKNILATLNAINIIICYLLNVNKMYIIYISISYYFYDIVDLLKNMRKIHIQGFLLHHILTILYISYIISPYGEIIFNGLFLFELSNLPIYLVYHNKLNKYNNYMKLLLTYEIISYFILRIICGGYLIFQNIFTLNLIIPTSCGILIYIISIMWLYKMIIQLKKLNNKMN